MDDDRMVTRARAAEAEDDTPSNPSSNPTMGDIIADRLSRRDIMRGALAATAISTAVSPLALMAASEANAQGQNTMPSFNFAEIAVGTDERHHVAEGYDAQILIRWGDTVLPGAPAYDAKSPTRAAQALQFGYNNDYLGYFPMPGAANGSAHGLLVVNHEYTNEELMFPGLGRQDRKTATLAPFAKMTREIAEVEMMAHGGSVLEIRKDAGKWSVVAGSKYARRITAETEMRISGPAAGHGRMKTKADPAGTRVLGMLNNCAGGRTPWGTWLTCEENFNFYFMGEMAKDHPEERNFRRLGLPGRGYNWGAYHERFDVAKEPNEANRFGWVVEIDPFDPSFVPVKRTALGRFKHEGASGAMTKDGRYVVYSGDDQRFDYVYKFVTEGKVDLANRAANFNLLDAGTLYVARYNADGTGDWIALVQGQGPLIAANGFASQADVVIETRRAGDMLGATRMDRPEDIRVNSKTNRAYLMLTNNSQREPVDAQNADRRVNAANPRAANRFGHIIEMIPDGDDHGALRFRWEILVRCGDPAVAAVGATFHANTTRNGWFGMPDNCAIDANGRLWIATDGNSQSRTGRTDGLWAIETEGAARATSRLFYRCPAGAELCGPEFTPDGETVFVAIQHPGEADEDDPKAAPATFENPATRWPDFADGVPPRPSVVVITKRGGGKIAV